MIEVLFCNEQDRLPVDGDRLQQAVRQVLSESDFTSGSISLAVVDDPTIHQLNREYLQHDYATDVLSFVFEATDNHLEGEVIVSVDTAHKIAVEHNWPGDDELLLYVVHGALHLIGYDDKDPDARPLMREAERRHLATWGLEPRVDDPHQSHKPEAGS